MCRCTCTCVCIGALLSGFLGSMIFGGQLKGFFDIATSLLTVVGVILVPLIFGLRTHGWHSIAALSSQTVEVFTTIDVL